ncbi:MAG: sialate O-acetylesterase [Phenylobacterium sp.]
MTRTMGLVRAAGAALAALALTAGAALAADRPLLGAPFQDHAVFQRGRPIPVWGWAAPGETVSLRFAGATRDVAADASGRWRTALPPPAGEGPHELTVHTAAGASQTLRDILVGEVWLCSGQSNMEMQVRRVTNSDTEVANSADPRIRLLHVPRGNGLSPHDLASAPLQWAAAGPDSVAYFSAACFFMGRELARSTGAAVGLIDATWGGSVIQDWISRPGLEAIGGEEAGLAVLDRYAVSPEAGAAQWQAVMDRWWATHLPDAGPAAAGFDDDAWPAVRLQGDWETYGVPALSNFDGVVWFRARVTLTAAQAAQGATLKLGPINDVDTTWVNGRAVGGMEGWDTPRAYRLAPGALHAGANRIAVRVLDTGGGGGLWGKQSLAFDDGSSLAIDGAWRYRIAAPLTAELAAPHAPWIPASGLSTLYNGMIAPIAGYGLRGVAWYQGEANVSDPQRYAALMPGWMADWRRVFGQPDLPFLIVQLAGFGPAATQPADTPWARVREVQRLTVLQDGHAGLATAIDIGDRYDIHPTNKQEVGRRLALQARRVAYGETLAASGPTVAAVRREGDRLAISFNDVAMGLAVYGSAGPVGFELCDAAGKCRFVNATAAGDRVIIEGAGTAARVRFCWADSPVCTLYNSASLPAVPFEAVIP